MNWRRITLLLVMFPGIMGALVSPPHVIPLLCAAVLPVFALLHICTFAAFDRLLRVQYADARSAWEQMGCPSGYFWAPPGSCRLSLEQRGNLQSYLVFDTPDWVKGSKRASRRYFWFVLCFYFTAFAFAPAFVGIIRLIMMVLPN